MQDPKDPDETAEGPDEGGSLEDRLARLEDRYDFWPELRDEHKRRIAERGFCVLVDLRCAEKRAARRYTRACAHAVDARRAAEDALRERVVHHLAGGWPEDAAQALAEGDTADLNYEADLAEGEAEAASHRWMCAADDVDDARLLRDWERRRAQRVGVTGSQAAKVAVRRPRGCDRQTRPRARRTAASSRTSGSDPGGSSDPDGDGPSSRPRLAIAPPPRAIYSYGVVTPGQRGEDRVVEAAR